VFNINTDALYVESYIVRSTAISFTRATNAGTPETPYMRAVLDGTERQPVFHLSLTGPNTHLHRHFIAVLAACGRFQK